MKKDSNEDPTIFKIHADFCKTFCNEKRLQILWKLSDKEFSVSQLAQELGISISNLSQHLRIMKDKGAVLERKDGRMVYYRAANNKFVKGCTLIREGLMEILQSKTKIFK